MPDLDIRVEAGNPAYDVDRKLRPRLAEFAFDREGFVEGLGYLGIPEQAIETLGVDFSYSKHYSAQTSYDQRRHLLGVTLGHGKNVTANRFVQPWEDVDPSLSRNVNYALAVQSSKMAETLLRHPSELEIDRLSGPNQRLKVTASLVVSSGIGAGFGAALAEENGVPVWIGASVGAVTGAITNGLGVIGIDEYTGINRRRTEITEERQQRAIAFADSDAGRELFGDIVRAELL